MVQKVNQSVWDSSDNITVSNITALKALPVKAREGVVLLNGHTAVSDGGGGLFIYRSTVPRSNDNNGTIIDPTDTGVGNGCWVRVYSLNTGSLSWFGSNDTTVSNLLSAYGVEGLIVSIPQATVGGTFQFKSAEIVNHDGVNNFNGWVRMNDVNFTENLKLNGHKITGVARAQGNTEVPNLEQVVELIQTGDYIGIVPLYADRVVGDGVTTIYLTPASEQVTPPPVNLISGPAFEVTVDGIKKRHVIDFTINIDEMDPDYAKLTWEAGSIPQVGENVDIVWFAPIIVDALLGAPITASESAVSNTLEDWFGTNAKDIIVQATGTTGYKNLGDRFAENAIYFDHIAAMQAGYDLYKPGMIVVVKGNTVAGDGFLGTYFIKTAAQADIDGDDYVSPGTFNILIAGATPDWVAVYQRNDPHMLSVEEQALISGQTEVIFANEIDEAYLYLIGDNVDDGRLIKDTHYTLAVDKKTVTLLESYPDGTTIIANWYEPEIEATGIVQTIVASTGITVNSADPANPVISCTVDPATKLTKAAGTTGAVISFATPQIYNSVASPSASNITDNLTGAVIGVIQKIYHNHSIAPTFPAGWVKLGSGTYTISTLNVIYCEWVSGTRVEYWITN